MEEFSHNLLHYWQLQVKLAWKTEWRLYGVPILYLSFRRNDLMWGSKNDSLMTGTFGNVLLLYPPTFKT